MAGVMPQASCARRRINPTRARVVGDPVPLEQREISGEWLFPVVDLLVPDVVPEVTILERRDAECAVAVLPSEIAPVREGVVDPLRGGVALMLLPARRDATVLGGSRYRWM